MLAIWTTRKPPVASVSPSPATHQPPKTGSPIAVSTSDPGVANGQEYMKNHPLALAQ